MSEVARRRIAALLLVVVAVVAALAIVDLGPFDDPPTPEEEVSSAVEDFFGAAADGDFDTFCALLTDQARAQLRSNAAQLLGEEQPCPKAFEAGLGEALKGATVDVREVSISGPLARVEARFKRPEETAQLRTIMLQDEDGQWLVSDPG
jgi:ketosteroid isomerase-like protein